MKNGLKGMLVVVMVMGMSGGELSTVKAAETTETITVAEDVVEFVDESGEVIAVFTPYSETNPAPDELTRATHVSVDTSLGGGHWGYLSNQYDLSDGAVIQLNITISPQVSSNIGLYNRGTQEYGWLAGGLSSSGWYGNIRVTGSGTYSLAFANNSDTTAYYTGSYIVP